ncbi:unnamed protein product [Pleuronectes platessa]|uniref:Uncharacterized protein n=1 Tax=Pleuronectes platessa TaxID=8262 RepID=A0A9N7V982_PLEPL|nr:unnamed protein product [Pleuronectes platessa]
MALSWQPQRPMSLMLLLGQQGGSESQTGGKDREDTGKELGCTADWKTLRLLLFDASVDDKEHVKAEEKHLHSPSVKMHMSLRESRAGPSVRFVVFDDSTGAEIKPIKASRRSLITPNLLDLEELGVTQPIRRDNLDPP